MRPLQVHKGVFGVSPDTWVRQSQAWDTAGCVRGLGGGGTGPRQQLKHSSLLDFVMDPQARKAMLLGWGTCSKWELCNVAPALVQVLNIPLVLLVNLADGNIVH